MSKIHELKEALRGATQGDWYMDASQNVRAANKVPPYGADAHIACGMQSARANAADALFITLAHNEMQLLLDVVEAAQAVIDHRRREFLDVNNGYYPYAGLKQALENLE